MNNNFEYLIDALKALPGVGAKQAKNIAYFLLNKDPMFIEEFIERIKNAKQAIHLCKQCNNYTTNEDYCDICKDFDRDNNKLCIVTNSEELNKIEATKEYNGLYYVLMEEYDVKKNKPLPAQIVSKLITLLKKYKFQEITIATSWTNNGEYTASYLKNIIKPNNSTAKIYRLAVGLPINSALDYADNITIKHALKNKTEY